MPDDRSGGAGQPARRVRRRRARSTSTRSTSSRAPSRGRAAATATSTTAATSTPTTAPATSSSSPASASTRTSAPRTPTSCSAAATSRPAVHLGDAADPRGADRMAQQVGNYRIEVLEPLRRLRLVLEETEGIAMDLTLGGLLPGRPGAAARDAPGQRYDARRAALRPGRHMGGRAQRRRRPTSRSPRTAGSAPATARGASARSARPRPRASRRTRRSRGCGGSTCRCVSRTSAS